MKATKLFKKSALALGLSAIATLSHAASVESLSLDELKDIDVAQYKTLMEGQKVDIRAEGIRDVAYRIGAQKGLYDAVQAFNAEMKKRESIMDDIIDFKRLMTLARTDESEVFLLPAVITEVNDQVEVFRDGREITISGKTYRILKPERLVTTPPTWWDYLTIHAEAPREFPPMQLLPQNAEERKIWKTAMDEGYESGLTHANFELTRKIEQLHVDYLGMQRYLRLFEAGMVDDPVVVARDTLVSGNFEETTLRESTYSITAGTALNQRMGDWKHILVKDERGALRSQEEYYRIIDVNKELKNAE